MFSPRRLQGGGCLFLTLVVGVFRLTPLAFSGAGPPSRALQKTWPLRDAAAGSLPLRADAGASSATLCGAATTLGISIAAVAGLVAGASRVSMNSVRRNLGQWFMPKVKKTRKLIVYQQRKDWDDPTINKLPRRYPLYDLLEEIYPEMPAMTIVSEPEYPLLPQEDVGLLDRYPWAGPLEHVAERTLEKENDPEARHEVLLGAFNGTQRPPRKKAELLEARVGYPKAQHPPWLNKPIFGTEQSHRNGVIGTKHFYTQPKGLKIHGWRKHRRFTFHDVCPTRRPNKKVELRLKEEKKNYPEYAKKMRKMYDAAAS